MSLNQCNTNTVTVRVTFISNLWHYAANKSLFISPPSPSVLFLCRAAQQSRRAVHIPPAASASPTASRLHLCPPRTLRSSQPAEEDHAYTLPDRPGQPGGRHRLKHWPGAASQQLGAQQQHPPGDQVNAKNFKVWLQPEIPLCNSGFCMDKMELKCFSSCFFFFF